MRSHSFRRSRAANHAQRHVCGGVSEVEFLALRTQRDVTLDVPTLILPALQVNIRAGDMPPLDENGVAYLRIPLNAFQNA